MQGIDARQERNSSRYHPPKNFIWGMTPMANEHLPDKATHGTASLVAISVIVLVGIQAVGVAAATAWALGGLLQIGPVLTWALGTVFCTLGAYITYRFGRSAWSVEKGKSESPTQTSRSTDAEI